MLNDANGFRKVYIAVGYTDLRRGIDGLSNIVQANYHLDPFESGTLFLFCGRRTDRIKGLLWEEARLIIPEQFTWLMQGLSIEPKKAIHKVSPKRSGQ